MWIKVNGTVRDMMKYLDGQAFTQRMEACKTRKRVERLANR